MKTIIVWNPRILRNLHASQLDRSPKTACKTGGTVSAITLHMGFDLLLTSIALFPALLVALLLIGSLGWVSSAQAQAPELISAKDVPEFGTFYRISDYPPLPYSFPDLPVYALDWKIFFLSSFVSRFEDVTFAPVEFPTQ